MPEIPRWSIDGEIMAVDAVSGGLFLKPGLDQINDGRMDGKGVEGDFEQTLSRVLQENPGAEQVSGRKAAAAAELIQLEMMHSAINMGVDRYSEPPQRKLARTLSLLIENEGKCPTCGHGKNVISGDEAEVLQTDVAAEPQEAQAQLQERPASVAGNTKIDSIINTASRRFGVEASLIKAVIKAESNFNSRAVSSAGARGLMQLMPGTARGLGVTDSFDPEQNVMAGTRFLKDLLNRYGGDLNSALAAYNWGPGNVDKRTGFLPRETRQYLAKVKEYYQEYMG